MTSVDDTSKRFEDVDKPQEIESNTLDGSKVRCFPTVKRTFRQKQSSWRWRWKYFTRALQPISEQGENTREDVIKVEENNTQLPSNVHNSSDLEASEVNEREIVNSNSEHLVNSYNEDKNSHGETEHLKSKEDYSACNKLIEKFQEAVLDNAVRVIQAAFKRFRERRRFLKRRRAATIIQRSVRHWLMTRHLSETSCTESCFAVKEANEWNTETQENLSSTEQEREMVDWTGNLSDSEEIQNKLENSEVVSEGLSEGKGNLLDSASCKADQFENSLDSLDDSSLSGSTDNISDSGVCIDQGEDNIAVTNDPDALSLADSGIDMYSDTPVEVTIVDDCKCSTTGHPLPNSTPETISELQRCFISQ